MIKKYTDKKKDGTTFTPVPLADFLAKKLLTYIRPADNPIMINDPACGDGALLMALAGKLSEAGIQFNISGSDKNPSFTDQTVKQLSNRFADSVIDIKCKDLISERLGGLFSFEKVNDVIIANPPYVRTQVLGAEYAKKIADSFGLTGRIDLYYPFLINMTESLRPGGLLGVITSNRFLTTKSGADIRAYLLRNYEILEIIDLGDTKPFDTAVLPAVFIGRKKPCDDESKSHKFISIYESRSSDKSGLMHTGVDIYDVINQETDGLFRIGSQEYVVRTGMLDRSGNAGSVWCIKSEESSSLITKIESKMSNRISDFFKVRVGIKSCADDVFLSDDFTEHRPEDVWFRDMISQENIDGGDIKGPLPRVIYPYYENNGEKAVLDIDVYPEAKAFFTQHEERLKRRSYLIKSKKKWYEYWVPQNPVLWKYPKLVWADISSEPRFAIDYTGALVNGNCYWICGTSSEDLDMLYLILGIANSKLMAEYHDMKFNNKLYSGKRRYLSQYVEQYPLPDIKSDEAKRILHLTKEFVKCKISTERNIYKSRIEAAVKAAFGITD